MGKYVVLREVDDKVVEAIKELDFSINSIVETLVKFHPGFVIDFLIGTTYLKDITAGGVRIFSGSRKKKVIKYKLLALLACIDNAENFIKCMNNFGLIRGVKEKLAFVFFEKVNSNHLNFLQVYGDPFPTYTNIYPIYYSYSVLRKSIVKVTFSSLSKIVLTNYGAWKKKRNFATPIDYCNFEEDVQNSSFSISKAVKMFNTKKHKSFFSYASGWVKEGIKSSHYTITEDKKINNNGVKTPPIFVSLETIIKSDFCDNIDDSTELPKFYISDIPSLLPSPEDNLIESEEEENSTITPLQFTKLALPLANELRVLYRLLQNS